MINASTRITKSLLAIHGWSAVFLGLLLYAVILTGTLAVFEHELGVWANPPVQASDRPLPEGIGARLKILADSVDPAYLDEVGVFPAADGRLMAFFHTHIDAEPGREAFEDGTLILLEPSTLDEVDRVTGPADEVFRHFGNNALSNFLLDLHIRLLLPGQWGLWATGLLGFAMLVAAVSGFVIHKHLLKDIFTLRRRRADVLAARDAHVIAGSWSLPFAFVLAFTGAFFSFGGAIGLPMLAAIAFGGDVETALEVLQPEVGEDASPAALADLDGILASAAARTGGEPQNVFINHWGRADALVTVRMSAEEGGLLPGAVLYKGASGEFFKTLPNLGNEPSFGGDLAGLMSPLHFGNFAGTPSKVVWFALGFASAYVALTGMVLWTRRRESEPGWERLARATAWLGYGLPASLAAVAAGYFLMIDGIAGLGNTLLFLFLGGLFLTALLSFSASSTDVANRLLLRLTGAIMLVLPLLRWQVADGPGWLTALSSGLGWVVVMDISMILGALACLAYHRRQDAPVWVSDASVDDDLTVAERVADAA